MLLRPFAAALVAACLLGAPARAEPPVLGTAPQPARRDLTTPPNAEAIVWRSWAPGLDDAYVPQGLTVAEGQIILAAYQHPKAGLQACRLYRIDPASGAVTGSYELPQRCGHAGGLAYAGGNRLFVSDSSLLIEVDLARAFAPGADESAVVRMLSLRFPLRGSFLAYHDGALWIGEYKKPGEGRIWRVALADIAATADPPGLTEAEATRTLTIPTAAQGAAFDRDGHLWLSQSTSQYGRLLKLDPESGAVLASHDTVAGIEDLGFDADGLLWSVSEAGSRRWSNWPTYYPLVLRIDPARLR